MRHDLVLVFGQVAGEGGRAQDDAMSVMVPAAGRWSMKMWDVKEKSMRNPQPDLDSLLENPDEFVAGTLALSGVERALKTRLLNTHIIHDVVEQQRYLEETEEAFSDGLRRLAAEKNS
jgi:hypothetical protein